MAAELVSRARKDTVRHFRDVGATAPEHAVTYQPQRHLERRALSYLLGREVVRLTGDGRYWLHEDSAAAWKRSMQTRTAMIAGGVVAAGVALFFATRPRDKR